MRLTGGHSFESDRGRKILLTKMKSNTLQIYSANMDRRYFDDRYLIRHSAP
jgi:hypothetical protein